jgi:membrane fusion protein (multidrug efflux system)
MTKRMIVMLSAMVALIAILAVVKVQQVQASIAQASSFQPPPEAVTTVMASLERWPATLDAVATVVAEQGVVVSADLPGIVGRTPPRCPPRRMRGLWNAGIVARSRYEVS